MAFSIYDACSIPNGVKALDLLMDCMVYEGVFRAQHRILFKSLTTSIYKLSYTGNVGDCR